MRELRSRMEFVIILRMTFKGNLIDLIKFFRFFNKIEI